MLLRRRMGEVLAHTLEQAGRRAVACDEPTLDSPTFETAAMRELRSRGFVRDNMPARKQRNAAHNDD